MVTRLFVLSRSFDILLHRHDLIVTHGGDQGDSPGLATLEVGLDFTRESIRMLRESHILTDVALLVHKRAETIGGDVNKGVFLADHEGDVGSVGGWDDIFVLLSSEDIDGGEVALSVTVLASLGSGDGSDLARVILDAHVAKNINKKIWSKI